ncbi:MAG: plastocyanin/azurin family copper-binding protein [Candidatus Eutrophobiaceae bacterium]
MAADYTINASAREYKPHTLYIASGETVKFSKMTSHNSVSVEGLIPEGATPWNSKMGKNFGLVLDVPGIYSYVCVPHIGFGMVGVIVVGEISQEEIDAYKAKAAEVLKGPYRRLLGKINKLKPNT